MLIQIHRDISNETILLRRCKGLMELQASRERELLGSKVDLQDVSDSEHSDSYVSDSSTIMSMSEFGDDF